MITTLHEALALYGFHSDRDLPSREHLIQAGKEAARWRSEGPVATALLLQALHDDHSLSFAKIEQETGIDHVTSQRLIRRLREGRL